MISGRRRYIGRKPYVKRRKAIHEERKGHILRRRTSYIKRSQYPRTNIIRALYKDNPAVRYIKTYTFHIAYKDER